MTTKVEIETLFKTMRPGRYVGFEYDGQPMQFYKCDGIGRGHTFEDVGVDMNVPGDFTPGNIWNINQVTEDAIELINGSPFNLDLDKIEFTNN